LLPLALAALAATTAFDPAHASPIIDQQQTEYNGETQFSGLYDTNFQLDLAQTFTVGITGKLDDINVVAELISRRHVG
jgi:hypothetical protein